MNRGDVYDARLDPTEGSEQAGTRPVVIVSRNALNSKGRLVVVVPFTTFRGQHWINAMHTIVQAPDGGLTSDSIALAEQVRALSQHRLGRFRGSLHSLTIAALDRSLRVVLSLPGFGRSVMS